MPSAFEDQSLLTEFSLVHLCPKNGKYSQLYRGIQDYEYLLSRTLETRNIKCETCELELNTCSS